MQQRKTVAEIAAACEKALQNQMEVTKLKKRKQHIEGDTEMSQRVHSSNPKRRKLLEAERPMNLERTLLETKDDLSQKNRSEIEFILHAETGLKRARNQSMRSMIERIRSHRQMKQQAQTCFMKKGGFTCMQSKMRKSKMDTQKTVLKKRKMSDKKLPETTLRQRKIEKIRLRVLKGSTNVRKHRIT